MITGHNPIWNALEHIFAISRLNELARLVKGFTPENVYMRSNVFQRDSTRHICDWWHG